MPNPFKHILIFAFITIYLSACATLNKDECKTANWRVIGYEDGAKGYLAERIGQHREACAEYGVRPDLDAYNNGRAEGLHQYCIPVNGYKKGLSGTRYNGVCSGYNEDQFINAYNAGKQLFHEKSKLHKMENEFSHKQKHLTQLHKELKEKEDLLVSGKLTKEKALHLLNETKDIAIESGALEENLHALEDLIINQEQYVAHLQKQHHY